jgi:hypothetical protein
VYPGLEVIMRTLNQNDLLDAIVSVPLGSVLFVSYVAGREPTDRAIIEAAGEIPRRYFTGVLHKVWRTKKNEWVLTMWTWNRKTLQKDGTLVEGAYRTFNPQLGQLILVDVIRPASC